VRFLRSKRSLIIETMRLSGEIAGLRVTIQQLIKELRAHRQLINRE
jgi:hypothetical protein